jgi:hypothetical protein
MSAYSDIENALLETFDVVGDSFSWSAKSYDCVIDHVRHTITTAKKFFGAVGQRKYPKCGELIVVAGRTVQIVKRGNAEIKAVSGGFVEDPPFIDDPSDPALDLEYDKVIKR